jgi:hypothetical protein
VNHDNDRSDSPTPDDDLIDDLIERDAAFQALLRRSASSPRKEFKPASTSESSSDASPSS